MSDSAPPPSDSDPGFCYPCVYPGYVDESGEEYHFIDDFSDYVDDEVVEKKYNGGMHCVKCNFFNSYITKPNQKDGTYLCYKSRSGF